MRDRCESSAPKDERNLVYLIFFWLGAGFLLPWNAFITGVDYFAMLFPAAHIDFIFALAYMTSNLSSLLLVMRFGKNHSSKMRITVGFIFFLVLILLVPFLDYLTFNGGEGSTLSLVLIVGAVVFAGIIDGTIQGSLFGMAGQLPERYTQALVAGTSASGVIISVTRIATKLALPGDLEGLRASANIYFIISSFFILLCVVGFGVLQKLPLFIFYEEQTALELNRIKVILGDTVDDSCVSQNVAGSYLARPLDSDKEPLKEDLWETKSPLPNFSYFDTFLQVWEYPVALTFVYCVTLSIFPGFISEGLHSDRLGDWYPVLLFFVFNLCDFLGKMGPTVWLVEDKRVLCSGTFLRVLFYPLFGLCVTLSHSLSVEPFMFLLTMALGFTNGLFTSWLMMLAPAKVGIERAESVGFIMVLFLIFGLFFGSVAGWVWVLVL